MNVNSIISVPLDPNQNVVNSAPSASGPGSAQADSSQQSVGGKLDPTQASQAVNEMNRQLDQMQSSTKVEMTYDQQSGRVWVNIVDRQSGQVIEELPPEGIRKMIESQSTSGLAFDKQF